VAEPMSLDLSLAFIWAGACAPCRGLGFSSMCSEVRLELLGQFPFLASLLRNRVALRCGITWQVQRTDR
jgi:hypothetical protein